MVIHLGPGVEFDLIRRFLERAASAAARSGPTDDAGDSTQSPGPGDPVAPGAPGAPDAVRVGPGDDCAVVAGDGIALTVDMTVEDVHFRRAWLVAAEIGYHAAAGAISDLAAMAARPVGILASVALGPGDEGSLGTEVMDGVIAAAAAAGARLLGGDVTRSPGPLVLDIVAAGECPRPVLRSGARPGDDVWVTGTLGGAAAAVAAWLDGREPHPVARQAFARPTPRVREAIWLAERGLPTAMVDLSDGIAGDAGHIAAASRVRLVIEAERLPLPPDLPARADALRLAAAGGEDYELCFTAAAGAVEPVVDEFVARFDVALTRVGRVEQGSGAVVLDGAGSPLPVDGFQHWRLT
jgi:thiamine-monophosphate kinase